MASKRIADAARSLAWSQWSELGVPGTGERCHDFQQIDLEALLWFTGTIDDVRLHHEVMDWLTSFGSSLALSRIKRLQRLRHVQAVNDMMATVSERSKQIRWNVHGSSLDFAPRGKAHLDLRRRSLLQLRLRALLGLDARAEVILVLLSAKSPLETAELTERAGFAKRAITEALDSLVDGGFVERRQFRNRHLHSMDAAPWRPLIGEPPTYRPWRDVYLFMMLASETELSFADKTSLEAEVGWSKLEEGATDSFRRLAQFSPAIFSAAKRPRWSHTSASELANYWARGLG